MKKLLIVVDYQIDFVSGSLGFPKAMTLEEGIVDKIIEFENNGDDVIFTLDTHYDNVESSMNYVAGVHKYKYISVFHKFLQSTVSHYTPSANDAERLIL